jgi:TetR/AcrR family transcriptional regulator, upper aerobic nicotinate degradation pathway regulator
MHSEKESHEPRKRILDAAKSEFAEKGYDGARMGAIARKAKVNQALIHYYFNTKEHLYSQVVQYIFGVDKKEMASAPEFFDRLGLTSSQRLYCAISLLVNLHLDIQDPDYSRIISIELARGRKHLRALTSKYMIPRIERIEQIIKDGIASGEFETPNTLFAVMNILVHVLSLESSREHFAGTALYDRIYGGDYQQNIISFILEHTFKALAPSGKTARVPELPLEVMKSLQEYIAAVKEQL